MTIPRPDDFPTLRPHRLQGRAYWGAVRALIDQHGEAIYQAAWAQRRAAGTFRTRDLCVLALQFRLHLKIIAEYLEDRKFIPYGTYERIRESRFPIMGSLYQVWADHTIVFAPGCAEAEEAQP